MEDLGKYLTIAMRWWWLVILAPAMTAPLGYLSSRNETPIYAASATIIVGQTIQSVDPSSGDLALSQQLAQTYADMALRQPVLQGVVETLDLDLSWGSLKKRISARPVAGTQLLEISAISTSAEEARLVADEVAHQLILLSPTNLQNREQNENQRLIREQIQKLKAKIEAGQETRRALEEELNTALSAEQVQKLEGEIEALETSIAGWEANYTQLLIFEGSKKSSNYLAIIEPAQVGSPSGPHILRDTIMAAIAGLFLAGGVIFLIEYLDTTLKSVDEIDEFLGVIILGTIIRIKGKQYQDKLITAQGPFSPASEAYRVIRSNIKFMSVDHPLKSIVVTSPNPGEGKSITVANLGIIMAQAGLKTIIVDADLRRPMIHEILGVPNQQGGLTALFRTPELDVGGQLRKTRVENLSVLTTGVVPPNPAELLGSQRMGQLLADLNEQADVVIYDSPPALAVTDAVVLSHRVDGVVLVIQAGRTRRGAAQQTVLDLQKADANLLGVVLNRVSKKRGRYYHQGYYYAPSVPPSADQPAQTRSKRRWQWLPFFK